ncbi:MAG: SH3 domain-containing protein, partial [Holosporales bacterium]
MSKKQSVVPVDLAQRVCAVRARARIASLLLILVGMPASAWAAKAPLPLPRFATFRSSEVNVRVGPGREYPVEWTYYRANLPVEIFQEYDVWRHIRDAEGTEGWVH